MALILLGASKCSICNKAITENDHYLGFSPFIEDDKDRLWRHSDSAVHQKCFEVWADRKEF